MSVTTVPAALAAIDPNAIDEAYESRGLRDWSDAQLIDAAISVLARPSEPPANSFVLHAPLELLARVALLQQVAPRDRETARKRIVWLAARYDQVCHAVATPGEAHFERFDDAVGLLASAVAAGELDDVDRAASWLGARAASSQIVAALSAPTVRSLAAAGHASIFFSLLAQTGGRSTGTLLRGPARELARHPDWKLDWFDRDVTGVADGGAHGLFETLVGVPHLGSPGSDFIYPLMTQAQTSGEAERALAGWVGAERPAIDLGAARHAVTLAAATSMLRDEPAQAPYGWTHCFTMPIAVLDLAERGLLPPRVALGVALTYVVGFRLAHGKTRLDLPSVEPVAGDSTDVAAALPALITGGAQIAAAAVLAAPSAQLESIRCALAGHASAHHDAHVVKYTYACLDAARVDPDCERLLCAASAYLLGWWSEHPTTGFDA